MKNNCKITAMPGNCSLSLQVYDFPPSSAKGSVFSVPVGEIKPQGVYDIPPTKGVSEQQGGGCVCVSVCVSVCDI